MHNNLADTAENGLYDWYWREVVYHGDLFIVVAITGNKEKVVYHKFILVTVTLTKKVVHYILNCCGYYNRRPKIMWFIISSFTLAVATVTKRKWYITDSFIVVAW